MHTQGLCFHRAIGMRSQMIVGKFDGWNSEITLMAWHCYEIIKHVSLQACRCELRLIRNLCIVLLEIFRKSDNRLLD